MPITLNDLRRALEEAVSDIETRYHTYLDPVIIYDREVGCYYGSRSYVSEKRNDIVLMDALHKDFLKLAKAILKGIQHR